MFNSPCDGKIILDEFISSQNIFLDEKKEKIKFLKCALNDLDLNYCSIPLPLSTLSNNQTSTEPIETNEDEENSSDTKKPLKAPTPDYDETYNFLSKLGEHDELRRKYAEERRKEYNEYLKEAKFATSRIKALEMKSEALRLQSPIRSYAELLEEKRASEKAYRHVNDHHITGDLPSLEPDFYGYNAKYHRDSGFDILNWQSKYPGSHGEHLVPKNRLFESQSNRVRASNYKEELRKQIEEKHHLDEEKRRQEEEEERLIEKRLHEQRLRMLKEFEEEQNRQRIKADSLAKKQEIIKEMIKDSESKIKREGTKDHNETINLTKDQDSTNILTTTPTSMLNRLARSPSYLHIRRPKSPRKSRASLESRFGEIASNSTPKKTASSPLSLRSKRFVPSPIRHEMNSHNGDHFSPQQYSEPAKYKPPDESEINKSTPINKNQSSTQSVNSGDRVLTRLSEVRQKMQQDHERMLQQLKEKI